MVRKSCDYIEHLLGIEYFVTDSPGIGGRIRTSSEDFYVEEVPPAPFSLFNPPTGGDGEYTWFVMKKRGLDTVTAMRVIARYFRISSKRFSAAGLKDARAVTVQLACVHGLPPEKLLQFRDETGKVEVIAAFRMPYRITPGMLRGNRFRIVIRGIKLSPQKVLERIDKISSEIESIGGVPNYYGHQRFGTIRPNTHIIGKYIIKGSFREAIEELVAHPYPKESPLAREAREYFGKTWDPGGALELFPKTLHHERAVLYYLAKHPNDYFGAIRSLPIQVRRLFIGALQAYLFNRVLSKRIELGLPISKAVPGDLVAVYRERMGIPRVAGVFRVNDTNVEKVNEFIHDGHASLVINVFGYNTVLADGEPGMIERSVLREEGLSLSDFRVKHMPEVASKGDLRKALLIPRDFKTTCTEDGEGQVAVCMTFELEKGMYATVVLREYMKPCDVIEAGF